MELIYYPKHHRFGCSINTNYSTKLKHKASIYINGFGGGVGEVNLVMQCCLIIIRPEGFIVRRLFLHKANTQIRFLTSKF